MAIILGSTFGEIRGKLGPLVFSRNAAGQIVRAYAVPVNHRSTAQQFARTKFSTATALWSTLSDEQKEAWNMFAKDPVRYSPLYKMNKGGINGQNAFVGMVTTVNKLNDLGLTGLTTPTGFQTIPYTITTTPPGVPNDGTINGGNIKITSATLTINTLTNLITATINCQVDPGASGPPLIDPNEYVRDGHGNPIGIGVLISSTKKNIPNFSKKMRIRLRSTGILQNNTQNPISLQNFVYTATRPITDFYQVPPSGVYVDLTLVTITEFGLQRKIDQYTTQVIWS